MAEEKVLTINLRKFLVKKPRAARGKEALTFLKRILKKIAKTEKLVIDKKINERIWSRGAKKPVSRLRIKIVKVDEKNSRVELVE